MNRLAGKGNHLPKDVLGWILLGISLLMLGRSAALCFCNDIWYDELFTVGMIEHSYGELIALTARDVHPPFYYCIVKFAVDCCKLINPAANGVIVSKLVSVLPYGILWCYSVVFVRKRFGCFTAGVFQFCITAMPQLSAYMVEIRMYGWALLFVTAALLHAYGTLQGDGGASEGNRLRRVRRMHGAALVFYGLAAAYTQYFACVAVVMVYLYVLLVFWKRDRGRRKEWLLWVAASVAGYMPWLSSLVRQMTAVNENYWILPLTWRSLGGCIKFLMKPSFADDRLNTLLAVVLFAVYVGVFALYTAKVIKLYHNGRVLGAGEKTEAMERLLFAAAGICVLGGLTAFGFAASLLLRPIFVYRYMIPALGCFWLSFAVCLDGSVKSGTGRLGGKRLAVTLLIVVIGLRNYRAFLGEEEYKALLMQDTRQALAAIGEEDIVIYNFDQVQAVTSYYMEDTVRSYLWGGTPEALIQDILRPYDTAEDTEAVVELVQSGETEGCGVWFIGSFNSREDIAEEWREAGLTVEEQGSYLLERYWFNLYQLKR
ncbi:MAG: hypothetical protein LUI12_01360 [Clostridiales bacterium]|nr:hypothetical protein [Clostridiales bacterium]